MDSLWMLAVLFLPLFPISAVLVVVIKKIRHAWLRGAIFLLWPQVGVWLLSISKVAPPEWLVYWVLATALLYAFRALAVRELSLWLSYIAISAWSIVWVVLGDEPLTELSLFAFGFSLPIALMAVLGGELEKRFSASYAGLYGGIAQTQPRLSAMLVFTLLGVMATPVFPGFFAMLSSIIEQMLTSPGVAIGMLVVWLLWSWSGMLMLQGLVLGPLQTASRAQPDLNLGMTGLYSLALLAMVALGLQFVEVF